MPQIRKKVNENVLFDREYQQKRRELKQAPDWFEPGPDGNLSGRQLKELKAAQLDSKYDLAVSKKRLANEHFEGNSHAVKMTELRQETQDMEELLGKVTSLDPVKVRGKKVTLKDFAMKQAFGLSLCATKSVYQYNSQKNSFKFKHSLRCGRRTCSVCSHFASREEGDLILAELNRKLTGLSAEEKKNGRLFHIVLTHENVPLEKSFEIFKIWRTIQKMKKQKYKTKRNEYEIWNVLQWGLWRWEVTRNEKTGLYHPHLHIIAYVQGYLAPEQNGYWNRLVTNWITACANVGLEADWEGQYMGPILYFAEKASADPRCLPNDFTPEQLKDTVEDAVAEVSKYAVKSTDFTKIQRVKDGEDVEDIANEMAMLFSLMNGRRLKNGFGGFSLRDDEEQEEPIVQLEEDETDQTDPEHLHEAIFTWDRKAKCYRLWVMRRWNEDRFSDYVKDMQNYKDKHSLMMYYGLEREEET